MNERKRITSLIGIMVFLCLVVGSIAILVLYNTSLEQNRTRLVETAKSRARLIESVARYDANYSKGFPGGWEAATISQVIEAHSNFEGFGKTGEFTLARLEEDSIVFLLRHRHSDLIYPGPVPLNSNLAEPMRKALDGFSGSLIGQDYRGESVLAAFEPVAVLNLGIVAKIDMAEIRAPFLRASGIVIGVASALIALGIFLFLRISNPIVERLKEHTEHLEEEIIEREKTEQMKDEFIGLVSHELRTPLTVITGSLRSTQSPGISSDDTRELIQNAVGGADELAQILENMLELSRHQADRLLLHMESIDLIDIAKVVIKKMKDQDSKQMFIIDIPDYLPSVKADTNRVERILNNLLENATKYSPQESEIKISCRKEGNFVITGVIDQGKGISPKDQEELFELFQQLEGSQQTTRGVGLGLVVCKRLVEAQGGWIKVDSDVGSGSVFSFALPIITEKA